MRRRLLAVMPPSRNYLHNLDVDFARSFAEAREMIEKAELFGTPYDDLELPVTDEKQFWQFMDWLEKAHHRYSIAISGVKNEQHFGKLAEKIREKGFQFLS